MPGLGFGPIVILPQEHIPWLIAQSDSVLSARIPQGDRIAIKYTMPSIDFRRDMFQIDIRKVLTPNLSKLQPILFEDMRKNIDIGFGVQSDHWREVELFKTMENIMFSSLNRVVVGEPLCSNSGYLGSLSNLIKWLGGGGLLVGQIMPPILKPILGYLAAIPILYYKARAMAYLLPVVKQRMTDAPRNELDIFGGSKEPLCLLDYMADDAVESKGNRDLTPEDVATNILFLVSDSILKTMGALPVYVKEDVSPSFETSLCPYLVVLTLPYFIEHTDVTSQGLAGVFPTILTATNNFLDILTSDSNQEVYKKIREEATAVFKSGEDWNDHNVLGRLTLADSAIKETLRRSPLLFRGIVREVTQKRGIDLPDGHHLAQGTWLGVAINGVHHDERFYENPNKYDAFRFARGQGIGDISDANGLAASSATAKTQGFTTTSDTYLPWGYGRHAW